jgi:hypothetical protein
LQHLIKQVVKSAYPHALGLFGKRVADLDINAKALFQFVGSPECPLPGLLKLTCIRELITVSA